MNDIEELNRTTNRGIGAAAAARKIAFYCCTAAGCISCGAEGVRHAIAAEIKAQGARRQGRGLRHRLHGHVQPRAAGPGDGRQQLYGRRHRRGRAAPW